MYASSKLFTHQLGRGLVVCVKTGARVEPHRFRPRPSVLQVGAHMVKQIFAIIVTVLLSVLGAGYVLYSLSAFSNQVNAVFLSATALIYLIGVTIVLCQAVKINSENYPIWFMFFPLF